MANENKKLKNYKVDLKAWAKYGSQLAIAYSPALNTTIMIVGNPRSGNITCNEFSYARAIVGDVVTDKRTYTKDTWAEVRTSFIEALRIRAANKNLRKGN